MHLLTKVFCNIIFCSIIVMKGKKKHWTSLWECACYVRVREIKERKICEGEKMRGKGDRKRDFYISTFFFSNIPSSSSLSLSPSPFPSHQSFSSFLTFLLFTPFLLLRRFFLLFLLLIILFLFFFFFSHSSQLFYSRISRYLS